MIQSGGLSQAIEEKWGIKAGADDLEKLSFHLRNAYGGESPEALDKAIASGEAAAFLTVNETYFFREQDHFKLLGNLLPSFEGKIRILSAATATGCEAYSIAMVIEHYGKSLPVRLDYHIDAFDINPRVIETAQKGVYGKHSFREDGSCFRYLAEPFLERRGDECRVKDSLKKNIRFFVHNIMDELSFPVYDLVFFRNAFIYFSPRSRDRVLANLAAVLAEGGYLIMGVSETAGARRGEFEEENEGDVFYFRKVSDRKYAAAPVSADGTSPPAESAVAADLPPPVPKDLSIDAALIAHSMVREEEAAALTEKLLYALEKAPEWAAENLSAEALNGNSLAVSVLCLLNRGDFPGAGRILDYLEERDDSAYTAFLRGEYFFFQDMFTEAEFHYKISMSKNGAFWPALYRLGFLARTDALRKYRAGQAVESLNRSRDLQYEVFIGGFSPDYYLGALLKQREDLCSFQN